MFITLILASFILFLSCGLVYAQITDPQPIEYEDIIVLKSGKSFSGIIFEQVPNKYYKIRLKDGTIVEFESFLVDLVSRQPKVFLPPIPPKERPATNSSTPVSQVFTMHPNADKITPMKSLWFTIGPNINGGYTTSIFTTNSSFNIGSGYLYGYGLSASCGTKIGDKLYVWGTISGDLNRMASSRSSYTVHSDLNEYRLGVGMSLKVQNYYIVWSLGQSFGERWDDEISDNFGSIRPPAYFSENFTSLTWGAIVPIDKGLAGSITTNINGLFETMNIVLKLGLVYTPNIPNE